MGILNKVEEILSVICLGVMTLLAFANVISRYVFSASFSFSEEITTYLFVLLSLLGTAIAAKRKAHLGLTIITDLVNPKIHRIMAVIGYGFAVAFTFAIFYYGILMVKSQIDLGQVTAAMQWPEWIFGSFVPFGSFFVVLRFGQNLLEAIKWKPGKEVKE
jgi:TRAP-type C4-dicarboxylate transport system permease small subunit